MANFADALNVPMRDVEKPEPLPVGDYITVVDGIPEITKVGADESPVVIFKLKVLQPMDGVDLAAFAKAGGPGTPLRHTFFYGSPNGKFFLKEFLQKHLGLDEDMSLGEAVMASPGMQCMATVRWRMDNKTNITYADVKSTAAL